MGKPEDKVRKIIADAVRELRNDKQDGYDDVKNGKFTQGRSLHFEQERLNALLEFAGVVPDAIRVNGSCSDCVFGDARGGDLGWSRPCCGCSRPKMTHFVPLADVTARSLVISDRQARLLQNAFDHVWWAEGLVPPRETKEGRERGYTAEWAPHLDKCRLADEGLKARDMLEDGAIGGRRCTNKGKRALDLHNKAKRAA